MARDTAEAARGGAQVHEVGMGERGSVAAVRRRRAVDREDLAGPRYRQWAHEEAVCGAEDRGADRDSDGNGDDGDEGEGGLADQYPHAVPHVLNQRFEH